MQKRLTKDDIDAAKSVDIVGYLSSQGFTMKQRGKIFWCSSPFASDSTPSFAVYPLDNRFKDYSSGKYGDIIELARSLHNYSFQEAVEHILGKEYVKWNKKVYSKMDYKKKEFVPQNYINVNEEEIKQITKYAESRKIVEGYEAGVFWKLKDDEWTRVPSLMFLHRDKGMKVTGAKFRNIDPSDKERFSARGTLGFYILENILDDAFNKSTLFLVESETSANSLYSYLKSIGYSCRVISYGGVAAVPKELPFDMPTKIIIDFDGNEKLYNERLQLYEHLRGDHIKMMLPKGEDLNSLWVKNKMNVINKLLFV